MRTIVAVLLIGLSGQGGYALSADEANANVVPIEVTSQSSGVRWITPLGLRPGLVSVEGNYVVVATGEISFGAGTNEYEVGNGGSLLCLDRRTGKRLWQQQHPCRDEGERPRIGIQSRPRIDGNRVYYLSNRGELMCLDLATGGIEWKLDLVTDHGICLSPDFALSNQFGQPLVVGNLVYCITGNGCTFSTPILARKYGDQFVPRPDAPSFLAVDKQSGRVVWSSAAPGKNLVYSWSSPVAAKLGDAPVIVFPGGDGVVYFFEPLTGRLLARHDLNPPQATQWTYQHWGTRVFPTTAPTVVDDVLYVGTAQDIYGYPKHAPLVAIGLDRLIRDQALAERWRQNSMDWGWTHSTPLVHGARVYVIDDKQGHLVAIDRASGKIVGRREIANGERTAFNTVSLVGNRLLVACGQSVELFTVGDELRPLSAFEFNAPPTKMRSGIMGPICITASEVFVAADGYLFSCDLQILGKAE